MHKKRLTMHHLILRPILGSESSAVDAVEAIEAVEEETEETVNLLKAEDVNLLKAEAVNSVGDFSEHLLISSLKVSQPIDFKSRTSSSIFVLMGHRDKPCSETPQSAQTSSLKHAG